VVVIFPNTYHQGFSTGSTLAEAINHGPDGWSIQGYSECLPTCPGFPIPNAEMEFRGACEEQIEEEQDVQHAGVDEQEADEQEADEQEEDEQEADEQEADEQEEDEQEEDEQEADEQEEDNTGTKEERNTQARRRKDSVTGFSRLGASSRQKSKGKATKRPGDVTMTKKFPTKKQKIGKSSDQSAFAQRLTTDQSYWKSWDKNREVEQGISRPIKAERVLESLSFMATTRRAGQQFVQYRFDLIVTMVMAVANPYAFQALREVITFL
jgi:hypothetical protein